MGNHPITIRFVQACGALAATALLLLGGCAGLQLPRIDPTGERIFLWPHEQPPGSLVGPPIVSTGPTASPLPPAAVLGTPIDGTPLTLPPQTAVTDGPVSPPGTVQAAPLWPDPHAPALFPHGFPGWEHCASGLGPLPPCGTTISPLAAAGVPAPVDRVQITPPTVVAPVGTEVVLRAGICADNGFLLKGQPMEWLLESAGVGQIVAVGQPTLLHGRLQAHHGPRKIDNHYALGRTAHHQTVLDRGTPQTDDDIIVREGESWLSVSSTIEGASRVTAVAKEVKSWQTRRATATVHWVDAQWVFPQSSVNPEGQSHMLTTRVSRLTDSRPLVGYTVRYELLDANVAGFAPDGAQVAEVFTNNEGLAAVELFPAERRAGTARVKVQVIRPAVAGMIESPRLLLSGATITKTWTAPDLVIQTTGPSLATVGASATYRVVVTNRGSLPASNVQVTAALPSGLSFVGSNPVAQPAAGRLTWSFATLEPGGTRTIVLDLRAEQAGLMQVCATVQSAEGQTAESCVSTEVTATAPRLEIQLEGPDMATVGEEVTYTVTVTNRGSATATGLMIKDTFDPGLEHEADTRGEGLIEFREFGDLGPGQSRTIYITFDAVAAGRQCHEVEVTGDGGLRAVASACVQVAAPAEPPVPSLALDKEAPRQAEVGATPLVRIVIRNTGEVPLVNIEIDERFSFQLEPREATEGYERIGVDTLRWRLDRLEPGQRRAYEVRYEMMAATAGGPPAVATTIVTVDGRPQAQQVEIEILPRQLPLEAPDGAAAVQPPAGPEVTLEVAKLGDPVRAGARTTLQVFLANRGAERALNVELQVRFSPELAPDVQTMNRSLAARNIQVARDGQVLHFTPIRELSPAERVSLTLPFDATQAGTARLEFSATSQDMAQPLTYNETVTVLPR